MTVDDTNAQQSRYWNDEGGPSWVEKERMYERLLAPFDAVLVEAISPRAGERVLDIGCGFGTTSVAMASRAARVHGIDISAPMVERATARAAAAGVDASFAMGDAQTDDLGGPHDAVVSRFGVMFFDDPVAAFANMAAATAAAGRLAFTCWQPIECNPWMTLPASVVHECLDTPPDPTATGPMPGPNPFAFGDRSYVEGILRAAGWGSLSVESVEPLIEMGGDDGIPGAVEQALNGSAVRVLLAAGDESVRERAAAVLAERFADHLVDGVVRMPSAAWLVTARR